MKKFRKWLCKRFGHKWVIAGVINNGCDSEGDLCHGYMDWHCDRCDAQYQEGINWDKNVTSHDVLIMAQRAGTQPWISDNQKHLIRDV